jgi:hypothetical protein
LINYSTSLIAPFLAVVATIFPPFLAVVAAIFAAFHPWRLSRGL